jgi:hypothetical protein
MTKNIVIVGGGTAGWLVALYVNKFWKDVNIKVISSSEIGILGAGESTTPNFRGLLEELTINELDFINNTNATIKVGNNFINWRGDGKSVVHKFMGKDPKLTTIRGFHFDAQLVAKYFKNIATQRGVEHIEGKIKSFSQSSNGDVTSVILFDETIIKSDFIFDCSGFNRLLIGDLFKQKWISYKEFLTIDSAIAFFLPQEQILTNKSNQYTKSTAMKYGWMWQAPLKHRWGCGYAFDSKYIDSDKAKLEIEDYLGKEISIVKKFGFNPGTFENVWVNNCIAIGLSSSFLEPLESTSLLTTIMMLRKLKETNFNLDFRDEFNRFTRKINEQNLLFIRYQYMSDRNDSSYWCNQKNIDVPQKLKSILSEDGELLIKNNEDIMRSFEIDEINDKLVFAFDSYNTIFKKNSNKFSNILL